MIVLSFFDKSTMAGSSGRMCAVIDCFNSSRKLQIWKKTECEIHKPLAHVDCPCLRPYAMHRFPGRKDEQYTRQQWIKNINRKNFSVKDHSTVCGIHFPDGKPTKEHPYPVLHLGYEHHGKMSFGRPPPKRRCLGPSKSSAEPEIMEMDLPEIEKTVPQLKFDAAIQWPDIMDHNYGCKNLMKECGIECGTQTDLVPSISAHDLDDNDARFYTGIGLKCFWELLNAVMAFQPQSVKFKLEMHDQLLLVLMRLRLGLLLTDLGKRFNVSRSCACQIFAAWRPILAKFMKDNIIAWLPRDTLNRIRPQSFIENYPRATCIIDCTEIFVQRPKNLRKRAQTYSNYKHHNTYKALYCIAPNGFVMFISKLFGGRASDTFIMNNSGLADHFIPGDEILADRGFTITDFLPQGVSLSIPAFTRGLNELPESEVTGTRRLANVRIHVERAIRRLKTFHILSHVIPGKVQNVDEIVMICSGLCNLQPQLIREENEE